ncbi:predicted protein [Naegleria gruberi]|uniref:Predicted protein n=1 Tax=Naegleria gruberi TaxID=5762 RepID=D2VMN2_NAEGR|nr:uncharacterized protein NAEGRDRAFT_70199 [Naegleria gruberi]EFC41860.1 predicted protein [Naegleria gruberi]|eukprot:XP_002674604.1 predicted protein [Naegleria gruberi strain NEG-M]
MGKASKAGKIILGIISGTSFVLSLLSSLLQISSVSYYAVKVQSTSANIEYYILMAIPLFFSLLTVILSALFFYDQILMRIIRERNFKAYNVLSKACCRSCCLKIFNLTHKSLCLAYVVSSVATVGTSLMSSILSGAVVRGEASVSLQSETVTLWFSSMIVCCVFGALSVIDSLLIMMRNYEKKEDAVMPASSMSSQMLETQSNTTPYDYKN